MSYAKVENDEVIKEGSCPINLPPSTEHGGISNFYLMSDEEKIQHGYYPVKIESEPQKTWQYKTGQEYTINDAYVTKIIVYDNITIDEYKARRIDELNKYLAPKFPDLYRQANAANGIYDEVKSQGIIDEVKQWRDYFYLWKGNIEACATYEEVQAIDYRTNEDKAKDEEMI